MADIELEEQYDQDARWQEYLYNSSVRNITEALEGIDELEAERAMTHIDEDRDTWELMVKLREVLELLEARYNG